MSFRDIDNDELLALFYLVGIVTTAIWGPWWAALIPAAPLVVSVVLLAVEVVAVRLRKLSFRYTMWRANRSRKEAK